MNLRWLVLPAVALGVGCGGAESEAGGAPDLGSVPASVPAPEVDAGLLLVTADRVQAWQADGEPFVLVDARDSLQYAQEHIPGAVNIPYVDIRPGANLPSREARIVVYCSDADCPISQYAYEGLAALGFPEIYDMREGLQGWKARGYPTVIGED